MSPESLKTIAAANAEIARFLNLALAEGLGGNNPAKALSAVEAQLPAIAATLEKAGGVLGPSIRTEALDHESRLQVELYTRNLQRLRELLPPLIASAEVQRRRLATGAGKIREAIAWLRALQSTEMD